MSKVAVITGAGAGVGRATADEFARQGFDVALLSRDPARLERAAEELRRYGVRALPIPTDVADAAAVEAAADRAEAEFGPIDVWVNVAMATVFSPVAKLTAEEVERGTKVTYLGQVHGMMSVLKRMRVRNRGTIVNVGSALAYRSVPLQSPGCVRPCSGPTTCTMPCRRSSGPNRVAPSSVANCTSVCTMRRRSGSSTPLMPDFAVER
jgi:NAD(P)-dependent dehydrogenase (short-subunit alcohol dehydrogenase family)